MVRSGATEMAGLRSAVDFAGLAVFFFAVVTMSGPFQGQSPLKLSEYNFHILFKISVNENESRPTSVPTAA